MAAPPPPPAYPDELPKKLGGYQLPPIYQIYHMWVGRGREAALRHAMAHQNEWRGKHHWDTIVSSNIASYDYGMMRLDVLDRYCTGDRFRNEPAGECQHRYRYAFVPGSPYSDDAQQKLIQESFRPSDLVQLLGREGWSYPGPSQIWSDARLIQIFERHTDLESLYRPHVEVHDVGEADCPALRQSLVSLDQLVLTVDPARQGAPRVPAPHGQQTEIRLAATTSSGGRVTVAGSDPLYSHLQPVWDAAEGCSPPSYKKAKRPS